MKKSVHILLTAVCVLMCLCLPFILCSASSMAEGAEEEKAAGAKALPVDFSAGSVPDPEGWTENGYSDDTITVRAETREEDGVIWRIVYVDIAHPSQLRTATAGKLSSTKVARPSSMAESKNAIAAINGDYFSNDPNKTTFEYRQGQKIRQKTNKKKDLLIIDMDGNFHTFIKCGADGKAELEKYLDEGGTIMDAFTFGPVLVKGGMRMRMDTEYGYNPNGREPRAAIGQMGELSYVLVVAEGRSASSDGVTHQELADFMFGLGCIEAFNLDGGNSATLIFHGDFYMNRTPSSERSQSDIIYFASAREAE
ncbi:MAG: phosphodiester glycosidase family protein [Clostridia bacterium]|nr:phosphodiester glycosidase family protein [Clostridia bacterium]